MRLLSRVLILIVALVMVIVGVGWLLPVGHVASRSLSLTQPPDKVYAVIADVARYPDWWADLERVEMLEPVDGKVRFRQHSSDGAIVMEVERASPPTTLVTRIADPDQPFGGTWTFELVAADGGTRLTLTERGEVYNPAFRFLARFVFGHTSTLESYLSALQRRFNP